MPTKITAFRWMMISIGITGLLGVYLFQRELTIILSNLGLSNFALFAGTRSLRFLVNDFLMILLIHGIFFNKRYTLLAFYVQLFGIVIILIPYLVVKYHYMSYNGPLVSYLHRLIVNPLLMLLLIPALIYKQRKDS